MPSYRVTKRALEVGAEVIETPEGVTPLITPDGSHIIIVEDISDQVSRQAARAAGRAAAKAAKADAQVSNVTQMRRTRKG